MEGSMGTTRLLLLRLLVQTLPLLQTGKLTLVEGVFPEIPQLGQTGLGAEPRLAGSLASAMIALCGYCRL